MLDFKKQLQETAARFRDRTTERETHRNKLEQGDPLHADTPNRVEKRLKRLGVDASTAKLMIRSDRPTVPAIVNLPTESLNTLERILQTNDLISVNFFERGTQAARPIGMIRFRRPTDGAEGSGTGFLVSPRLLLTNNHVLPDAETATSARVEFDYQDGVDGNLLQPIAFQLLPEELFLTHEYLDYTLIAVQASSKIGVKLTSFGWHPLIEAEGKVIIGESLSIIQHPNGERKQVALRENRLQDVLPDFLHYTTDTAPGSSGSPVFNDQWEVVALHHSGVPKRDANGNILNLNGQPWQEEEGEHRVDWIANEGVRISRIVEHIKGQSISAQAQPLITEMFTNSPNSRPSSDPSTLNDQESRLPPPAAIAPQESVIGEDGTVTWTIPLQVSVKFGQPVAHGQAMAPAPVVSPAPTAPAPLAVEPAATKTKRVASTVEFPSEKTLNAVLKDLKSAAKKPYYSETSDRKDRETYYVEILSKVDGLNQAQLYQALSHLVINTHNKKLSYKPSQHLYPWVDLHPDLKIRSIYSDQVFEAEDLIRADFQVDQLRAVRSQELLLKESLTEAQFTQQLEVLEASLMYNCEHVVPQSWFAKKEPMRGDLHHLFACETRCNSFRGNTPYYDFEDFGTVIRDSCGKLVGEKFEPSAGKGAVARATFYFLLRYPGEINQTEREYQSDRLPVLLEWHQSYPVSDYEKHRNAAIYASQGNRNPLIDFPEWADHINFHLGLG